MPHTQLTIKVRKPICVCLREYGVCQSVHPDLILQPLSHLTVIINEGPPLKPFGAEYLMGYKVVREGQTPKYSQITNTHNPHILLTVSIYISMVGCDTPRIAMFLQIFTLTRSSL